MKSKILGIEFFVEFQVIAIMTLILIFDKQQSMIVSLAAALIHETGHIWAMHICRSKPQKIIIKIFDIQIVDCNRVMRSIKSDIFIVISGIIINIISCILFFGLFYLLKKQILYKLAYANLFVGLFNALPAATLDGGQAVYLMIARKFSANTASLVIDILTVITIIPVGISGILVLLNSKYNFSLLFISIYLMSALVLKKSKFY